MYKIGSLPHSIPIGYTGETNFRAIEIDMTAWMEKMPAGVPSIVHIRPGESKADAYVAVTEFDTETNVLTWNITAADIGTLEGEGIAQIWLEELDEEDTDVISKRGKSVKVITKVTDAANDPSPAVPSSQEAFMEQVTAVKTAAITAKEAAEDAKEAAETAATAAENVNLHPAYIDETTLCWMVWSKQTGAYVNTGVYASGDPEILIDDTTGSGTTNKTWSANKLEDEFDETYDQIIYSSTQPTETVNKLWINGENDNEYVVPTYTEFSALSDEVDAIKVIEETVSGSAPSIIGVKNHKYICGECSTLSIVAPASGIIDVMFESGTTPTVLTVTSAKTGVTAIKWANGFDTTSIDASTIYELNIMDGEYGVSASWT